MGEECIRLLRILESARTLKANTSQTKGMIAGVGEKLGCLLITALLQTKGMNASYIDLGEISDHNPTASAMNSSELCKDIARVVHSKVLALDPKAVPVIIGWLGETPDSQFELVGQDDADLCAAITTDGLQAIELQIWKEVYEISTADPRKIPTARLVQTVTPAEAVELTFCGFEVLHPFTLEYATRANVPTRFKNIVNLQSSGTVILANPANTFSAQHLPMLFRNCSASGSVPKLPAAVTVKSHITVMNVCSNRKTQAHGFLASVVSTLAQNRLSVDLISSSEVHVPMAIHSANAILAMKSGEGGIRAQTKALQHAITSLQARRNVSLVPNQAIISLVGHQLWRTKGIAGQLLSALGQNGINVEMISQGASEISISCVIKECDAIRALNVVHSRFFAPPD